MIVFCGRDVTSRPRTARIWRNGKLLSGRKLKLIFRAYEPAELWQMPPEGGLMLAYLLLLESVGSGRAANRWASQFRNEVLAQLGPEWILTEEDILEWYRTARPALAAESEVNNGQA